MRSIVGMVLLAGCGADTAGQAVALSWLGSAGTQIGFDTFSTADHTIMLRFAPRYPLAATQAVLGENGGGAFLFGLEWSEDDSRTTLALDVGTESVRFPMQIRADEWVSAALVGRVDQLVLTYEVWIDGAPVEPTLSVSINDLEFPSGSLNVGGRTFRAAGPLRQYYGLVDDLAVYDEALRDRVLERRMSPDYVLRGSESGLIATVSADDDAGPLESTLLPSGPTIVVDVADHATPVAPDLTPAPQNEVDLVLPFEPGVAWRVVRGYADASTPHLGVAAFGLDFEVDGHPPTGKYPSGTSRAPIRASAAGTVVVADDIRPPAATIPNVIEIRQADDEYARYHHIAQGGSDVAPTDSVEQDSVLGEAGDVGSPTPMIHIEVGTQPMSADNGVTFPVTFVDYELMSGGTWVPVARGTPGQGDVVRRPSR